VGLELVLVSACLLGDGIRYDGGSVAPVSPILDRWVKQGRVAPFCPEVAGGLPFPRPPAEIRDGTVWDCEGRNVTREFVAGAEAALELARAAGIRIAVLKDRSPSCGSSTIHNGKFDGGVIPGEGVTTALLRRNGIEVFREDQLEEADRRLTISY
jgi:uncharacterized protein YbbK (DUF523 family)